MLSGGKVQATLRDTKLDVKVKLSGLWASVMFCYVYADFIGLFRPGKLEAMLAGKMPLGTVSQGVLSGMAAVMLVPSLMVVLSLTLTARLNRWANIAFGIIYTVMISLTLIGAWLFYVMFASIEMLLTMIIVWFAWSWPRELSKVADCVPKSIS